MNFNKLPLTTGHWGTYRAQTRDGKLVDLHAFEQDADMSSIGRGYIDTIEDHLRVREPMIRRSWLEQGHGAARDRRGSDPFVAVSWDDAETLVAEELGRVRRERGNQAIFGGSYGWASAGRFHHAQSQLHRFLNCIGGYTRSVNTYSFAAAEVIVPHVLGDFWGPLATTTSWDSIIDAGRLVVAFGGLPLKNGQMTPGGVGAHTQRANMRRARDAGVHFVNISPLRSDTEADLAAEWLPIRPNTDTALMLALAHTLAIEDLADTAFLETYTVGYDRFVAYLSGASDGIVKDVDWAARLTEIPSETIRHLARRMASDRTMISVSWSLTRQDHGEQPYWAAIALAAMLGQIGLPGGGIGFGYSASNNVGDSYNSLPVASLPQGANPVSDFIPVARISDMLERAGQQFHYDGQTRTYPDIDLIYWAGGNPFHHHQNLNRLLKAWRKPSTIIVHDWTWNALAKRADIVLPCTTPLEREDLAFSPYDRFCIFMNKVIQPVGLARDDYDILSGIAEKMGVAEQFTEGKTAQDWLRDLYETTRKRASGEGMALPEFDHLRERGWHDIGCPQASRSMLDAFRAHPDRAPLATPSGRIEIFSETIEQFGYRDCIGHPAWFEPLEWLGGAPSGYPLHLVSNQPTRKLHSQLDHGSHSRDIKINGREAITIHPVNAVERGLRDGDIVRVFNQRGACLAGVVIDDSVRPMVVQMSTGAWFDPDDPAVPGSLCKHGNVNVLTPDVGTSRLAQGPIAHTCMVEVEKFDGPVPALTAFTPPEILRPD